MRRVEIFFKDSWVPVNFMELKTGDIFRMFDDPGTDAIENGEPLIALGDSYPTHDVWTIECEREVDHVKV